MSGIYIHIPFCKKACTYCNFHFSTTYSKYRTYLIDSILLEIKQRRTYLKDKNIKTIYFGGGTPSLLNEKELNEILNTLQEYYTFNIKEIEITLEANPDDLSLAKLKMFKKVGINRLSIGIQSFNNDDLILLNRSHDAKQAIESIYKCKEVGFTNFNIDLIFALPNLTKKRWLKNLSIAKDLSAPHLSIYNLTVEPKTKLYHDIKYNKINISNDKEASLQFYLAKDFLEANEYNHYEISNYSLGNKESLHNTNYWKNTPYIGFGPGAHSYNNNSRQWNISNNQKYLQLINNNGHYYEKETISTQTAYNEYILTSIRTMWGCDQFRIQNFGQKYINHFLKYISTHIIEQNIEKRNNTFHLTIKGLIISDHITSDLLYVE